MELLVKVYNLLLEEGKYPFNGWTNSVNWGFQFFPSAEAVQTSLDFWQIAFISWIWGILRHLNVVFNSPLYSLLVFHKPS